jgi:hypothetical protein
MHPEDLPEIGIICIETSIFLVNTALLSSWLGCRYNGLNKIFRTYHFDIVPNQAVMARVNELPWPEGRPRGKWSMRKFKDGDIGLNTSEEEGAALAKKISAKASDAELKIEPQCTFGTASEVDWDESQWELGMNECDCLEYG